MDYQDVENQFISREKLEREKRLGDLCIYGAPKKLIRQLNAEAYVPQSISIGPLHHDKPHLRAMQPRKLEYLFAFIARTEGVSQESYYKMAKGWVDDARECYLYESDIFLDSNQFAKMILLDGVFMLELLLRYFDREDEDDVILNRPILREDIFHDIMLLENQIPFFILEDLYKSLSCTRPWDQFLRRIASKYFKREVQYETVKKALKEYNIRDLVDFIHVLYVLSIPQPRFEQQVELSRSATELYQAGVKFVLCDEHSPPYYITFEDGNLFLPGIEINRWTESFFLNLIAYEHCLQRNKIVSSYIIMMSSILKTSKDVDLLISQGILINQSLGDSGGVCILLDNLYQKSTMNNSEFYYASVCKRLNAYSSNYWHEWKAAGYRWKEILKRDYFSSPWSIIALIGAIIALILTIIQTYCSIATCK